MTRPSEREAIANRLADAYLRNPLEIARLCDEVIDRSGNLLGWLRDVARERGDHLKGER